MLLISSKGLDPGLRMCAVMHQLEHVCQCLDNILLALEVESLEMISIPARL